MNSKKTSNENSNTSLIKRLLLLIIAVAISVFLLIFSILSNIQNTQIQINPSSSIQNTLNTTKENNKVNIFSSTGTHTFQVALATTEESRREGLMGITSMNIDQGMLFIFPESQYLSFWMKNTYIPLDIIFIDENLNIIQIHENTTPLDESIHYRSNQVAKYVLEVNANTSTHKNIKIGDKIQLEISI